MAHIEEENGQASETSPLLSKDQIHDQIRAVEPQDGIAPEGTVTLYGTSDENDEPASGGNDEALERQPSAEDRRKHYEGMPEVKKQMKYIMPALAIGIFLAAADQSIIVSSYERIGSDLKALNRTSWIATAYFLTLTSFQPLYGKFSDIFGREECLLFAYAVFAVGCLFCGLALDMNQLIAARAFAGIGGGGMSTVVSILLSDVIGLRERGKWQGYLNIIFATGSSSGAPLGGILSDYVGWRWAFFGQVPLIILAIVAVAFTLRLPQQSAVEGGWRKKLARIDFLGAVILIAGIFTLLVALDRGSNVGWKDTLTIVSIAVSIPLLIIFVVVEMKLAKEPFAPGHVVFHRTMIGAFLVNFFSMCAGIPSLFYNSLYFQAVHDISATGAGLRLIPPMVFGVSGSLFAGFYMERTGRYYWLTVVCYLGLTIGMVAIFLFSGVLVDSQIGVIIGMCVNAFSNGTGITTTLISLIANAGHEDQAVATACSYLFRSLGSVVGLSLSATVANQVLRGTLASELPALGLPTKRALEIAERVRESLAYLRQLEPAVRAIVVDCYSKSISAAFAMQIGLVLGAVIAAVFINEKTLGK